MVLRLVARAHLRLILPVGRVREVARARLHLTQHLAILRLRLPAHQLVCVLIHATAQLVGAVQQVLRRLQVVQEQLLLRVVTVALRLIQVLPVHVVADLAGALIDSHRAHLVRLEARQIAQLVQLRPCAHQVLRIVAEVDGHLGCSGICCADPNGSW